MTRLVIVGASGMVGGSVLHHALQRPCVDMVVSVGRKNLRISHPKLTQIIHSDFGDCSALAKTLSSQDVAIFCLGTYTGAVSEVDLRKITLDYAI
jgi:putative NADH-flavin reductase